MLRVKVTCQDYVPMETRQHLALEFTTRAASRNRSPERNKTIRQNLFGAEKPVFEAKKGTVSIHMSGLISRCFPAPILRNVKESTPRLNPGANTETGAQPTISPYAVS